MKSTLQKFLEDAGLETRSYSGRYMFGESCLAVEYANVGELFASIVSSIAYAIDQRDVDDSPLGLADLAAGMRRARTDDMGRGCIMYFPGTKFVSEEDDIGPSTEG